MEIKIMERRKALDLSQMELAHRAGIGQHTVSDIETGLHVPKVDIAIMIARALDSAVEELFVLENDRAYPV